MKNFREAVDVGIGGVDPELVELVRAGFFRRQPDRAAFGFTELGAVCFGDQRHGQTEHLLLVLATRQIDTRGDVAPLIGTADLQLHLVAVVQLGEIEALQQVIGKLGEGDAGVVAIQALLNRFPY